MSKIYYTGTVIVVRSEGYGFIDLGSVKGSKDAPELTTKKNIFIHADDCTDAPLKRGQMFRFTVEKDGRRKGGLRAMNASAAGLPLVDGIELHFDQKVIDHPMIPIRWRIKPEIAEQMAEPDDTTWFVVIVAMRYREEGDIWYKNYDYSVFLSAIGLKEIGICQDYLTLPTAGTYDVVAYLVRSNDHEFGVRSRHKRIKPRDIRMWRNSARTSLITDELCFLSPYHLTIGEPDNIVGTSYKKVTAPVEIFSNSLTPKARALLGYYGLDKPDDDCALLKRLPLLYTFGLLWCVVWELTKRSWMLLVATSHFLIGGSPLPMMRSAFSTDGLSATMSDILGVEDYSEMMEYDGWKNMFRPVVLLCLVALALAMVANPHLFPVLLMTILVTGIGVLLSTKYGSTLLARLAERKERNEEHGKKEALSRIKSYVPDKDGQTIQEPMTVHLVWSGIKRRLCRPLS